VSAVPSQRFDYDCTIVVVIIIIIIINWSNINVKLTHSWTTLDDVVRQKLSEYAYADTAPTNWDAFSKHIEIWVKKHINRFCMLISSSVIDYSIFIITQ